MTKLVLILSFIGLAITLTFGLLDPTNPIMWLASTSSSFTVLRGALMAIILSLLMTEPPRNAYMRVLVGITSAMLIGWSLKGAYYNQLPIVDAFLLLAVGIATGITVLERDFVAEDKISSVALPKTAENKLASA